MKKNYIISAVIFGIHLLMYVYMFSGNAMPYNIGFFLNGTLAVALIINLINYICIWGKNKGKLPGHTICMRSLFLLVNIICFALLLILFLFFWIHIR